MKRGLVIFGILGALAGSLGPTVSAGERNYEPLSANEIQALLPGHTIKGEYRYMRARTKTYQFQEQHFANGTTHYKEGSIETNGIWYTLGEAKVCYKYPNSTEMGSISCFWVYNDDGCYYGYSLSEMSLTGPRSFDNWSAR